MRGLLGSVLVAVVVSGSLASCRSSSSRGQTLEEFEAQQKLEAEAIIERNKAQAKAKAEQDALNKKNAEDAVAAIRKQMDDNNAADSALWKAREERDRLQYELDKAKKEAEALAAKRKAEDEARAELERLKNLTPPVVTPPLPTPAPDITITILYRYGRTYVWGTGSFTNESKAYTFSDSTFKSLVQRGLSCDLKAISETIYSCDYMRLDRNCGRACFVNGSFDKGVPTPSRYDCQECRRPSLSGGVEDLPKFL